MVAGVRMQGAIFVLAYPFSQDILLVGGLGYFLSEVNNDWEWFGIVHFLFFFVEILIVLIFCGGFRIV